MVKLWAICKNSKSCDLLRYLTVFCFVFFIAAQPMVEIFLSSVDTEYELCENYEDDDVEEKEELKEEQKQEPEFYPPKYITHTHSTNISVYNVAETSVFYQLNYIREFYLEILLPPPELT